MAWDGPQDGAPVASPGVGVEASGGGARRRPVPRFMTHNAIRSVVAGDGAHAGNTGKT
jgi:hypothetical protein